MRYLSVCGIFLDVIVSAWAGYIYRPIDVHISTVCRYISDPPGARGGVGCDFELHTARTTVAVRSPWTLGYLYVVDATHTYLREWRPPRYLHTYLGIVKMSGAPCRN